jgi:hypothetical protein|tara:strand:+ start:213 stop:437 length:225 start_codon:yes stop_codon:yes gene_type:complete
LETIIAYLIKLITNKIIMDILENLDWQVVLWSLVAILEVVVRLTPSEKDNSILNKVVWVLGKLVPNKKKNGKTF